MTQKKRKSKPPTITKFNVGDKVRVKHGITDVEYPDMPMGGWVGTISEVHGSDMYGILCEARHERRVLTLPLGELEVKKGNPNRQLVADYSYWFWNWR